MSSKFSRVLLSAGALAVAAVCASGVGAVSAGTIISDTFASGAPINGSGSYLLGSSPDIGPAGQTWVTNLNGTGPATGYQPTVGGNMTSFPKGTSADLNAAIAFTPAASGLLSFTTTEDFLSGSWNAIGFADSPTTVDPYGQVAFFVLVTRSVYQLFKGNVGSGVAATGAIGAGSNTITLTYDPTSKTENVYFNGSLTSSGTYTFASAPTIGSIFISNRAGVAAPSATFSNLTLTQGTTQTPEPATLGLLAVGSLGLLLVGRKRANRLACG